MFRACGGLLQDYEPLHWDQTGNVTHYAVCAPASGDTGTVGICRSDGVGHETWEYCADAPAAKCGGLAGPGEPPAKLWFALCADVDVPGTAEHMATVLPTVSPTAAPAVPTAAPTAAPTVAPTAAPTATPTAAATPAPSEAAALPASCVDSPGAATNLNGAQCGMFESYPFMCQYAAAYYDDGDFTSGDMCCACGGGVLAAAPTAAPAAAPVPPAPALAPSRAPTSAAPTPVPTPLPVSTTLTADVDPGATSLMVASTSGLGVGDELLLSGGGHLESVTVAGFGTVLLAEPTVYGYPAGATVAVAAQAAQAEPPAATVSNDPHVTNLNGESFDIRMPSSGCTLLRMPYREEDPEALELSASMDTDGVRACGLYVKGVTLRGSLLGNQVVRVRPYTRNAGGSNQAGTETVTEFSVQVGGSPWRSFSRGDAGAEIPEARVGLLRSRFVWREEFGERIEAQSLELRVGEGERSAIFTVSQAPHQALNIEIQRLGALGHRRVGGALGTEGRNASLEQPSLSCRLATTPLSSAGARVFPGFGSGLAAAPASSMSAAW